MIEIENVFKNVFKNVSKNVSLEDSVCSLCHKAHNSLECLSLRSIIEMVVTSTSQTVGNVKEYGTKYNKSQESEQ